jgi:hypothetical protein
MTTETKQRVLFEDMTDKPVCVEFTAPDQSSDGGVLLLKAIDSQMGLTERLAAAIRDPREAGKVRHPVHPMLQGRVLGIACGYPDANDAAKLDRDPAIRLACERREEGLASQPTLSRFENAATPADLLRMAMALTDAVLDREAQKRKPKKIRRITVDMDPTEDRAHGRQQLIFFNAFYDSWCYLPMVTTVQFGNEPEHYAVAPMLRPGNAAGSAGAVAILKRLLPRLRKRFPKAVIRVRLDGAFATPEVFDWLETKRLGYAVNMAKNSVLKALAEPRMEIVRAFAEASGATEKVYGETRYQAGKWKKARRVIVKAEVVALDGRGLRDNPRFIVTNLRSLPRAVYNFYAKRGDAENRIKELKNGLRFDLTSCTRFGANQFRTLLAVAAYALYQQLRYEARGTDCARAQVATLRERLVKVSVIVAESVRRILLEAPRAYVWFATWRLVAFRLGASP